MLRQTVLSVEQMQSADAATIASGVDGYTLMQRAGEEVAAYICEHYEMSPVLVLSGPGNNGGDGLVVARLLQALGWPVTVALLGERARLQGDAAKAAQAYAGELLPIAEAVDHAGGALVVDALFGTGLQRPLDEVLAVQLHEIRKRALAVVAVDIPSGVQGNSGEALGMAMRADATVTFVCKKYGHLLYPGRSYCGEVRVVDIGIPPEQVEAQQPSVQENHPLLWQSQLRIPNHSTHKYHRGHGVVAGGPLAQTGAARLAAYAALRAGAGLVSVACDAESLPIYAADCRAVMTKLVEGAGDWEALLADPRLNAWLIGPGCGVTENTKANVIRILQAQKPCVLDADALMVFEEDAQQLYGLLHAACVLTPHEGEFRRLFGSATQCRLQRAREAAKLAGCTIVLKGADTVIAAADGQHARINSNAPPWLATAGSGDVLAGMITGLLAQGLEGYEAASAAVWMHAEAAQIAGAGMISEDLPATLPSVWQSLLKD